jgi:hypothetical protein
MGGIEQRALAAVCGANVAGLPEGSGRAPAFVAALQEARALPVGAEDGVVSRLVDAGGRVVMGLHGQLWYGAFAHIDGGPPPRLP